MITLYFPNHSDYNLIKSDLWKTNNKNFGYGSYVGILAYHLLAVNYWADLPTFCSFSIITRKTEIISEISLTECCKNEIKPSVEKCFGNCGKSRYVNISLQIVFLHHGALLYTLVKRLCINFSKVHANASFLSFKSSLWFCLAAKYLL